MFLPTSPSPPSGITRNTSAIGVGVWVGLGARGGTTDEKGEALEAGADPGDLLLGRRHERQPVTADLVAEQVQRRLDRDRVRRHLEQLVRRPELTVELPPSVDVAVERRPDLLRDLRADDVRVDADPADTAELDERLD